MNSKNSSKILIIILLFIVVLLSGVIVFLLLAKPKDIKPVGTIDKTPQEDIKPLEETDKSLSFETIDKRFYSGHTEEKKYVITETKDWSNLWSRVKSTSYPKPQLPSIDFTKEIVIAVFQGEKNTGGYEIEITKIVENKRDLTVHVKEVSPGPKGSVSQAFTQPYHIIKLQKTGKKVKFIVNKKVQ